MNATEGRQFVDTNVLLYAHDVSAGAKHIQAKALLRQLWASRMGCLSMQVLQEFYVNVTRKIPHPLSPTEAAQIIARLAIWDVHRPNVNDVLSAITLQGRYQLSFWDAMILTSAQRLGCRTVWSEDLNAGQVFGETMVQNPFTSR